MPSFMNGMYRRHKTFFDESKLFRRIVALIQFLCQGKILWQRTTATTENWSSIIPIQKISIMQVPYNPITLKLSPHIQTVLRIWERQNPRLEIFLDDDEARESEWEIYGTLLDAADDRFADVRFASIGDEREFQICSSRFRIMFDNCYSDTFIFPNGSTELMPVYQFLVKPMP